MSRRVVVGLMSLTLGIATIGCTSAGPRRFSRPQEIPPAAAAPQPPASPRAVAATEPSAPPAAANPPSPEITRVSVPPPVPGSLAPEAKPTSGNGPRELYQRAVEAYTYIDSYTARLRRREQVGGKDMPEELMLAQFRKKPFSVHFKWIGAEGQGRELIYVQGRHEDKIHTLLAPTDPRIFSKIMALPPDSPLVRNRSRYPITDAGIGPLIGKFGQVLALAERAGPTMMVKALGPMKRPEYTEAVEGVEMVFGPHIDPLLPEGGRRWWFFDSLKGLPVLVFAQDPAGKEVEYYCYDRLMYPVRLDDDDFDPRRLGKDK